MHLIAHEMEALVATSAASTRKMFLRSFVKPRPLPGSVTARSRSGEFRTSGGGPPYGFIPRTGRDDWVLSTDDFTATSASMTRAPAWGR